MCGLIGTYSVQGGAEASLYQTYKIVHTGRLQALTMSGSDVLYISQLETHLAPTKTNRLTLGGLISKLGDDSPKPAKVSPNLPLH